MKARCLKGSVWTDRYVQSFTEATSLITAASIIHHAQIFIRGQDGQFHIHSHVSELG